MDSRSQFFAYIIRSILRDWNACPHAWFKKKSVETIISNKPESFGWWWSLSFSLSLSFLFLFLLKIDFEFDVHVFVRIVYWRLAHSTAFHRLLFVAFAAAAASAFVVYFTLFLLWSMSFSYWFRICTLPTHIHNNTKMYE